MVGFCSCVVKQSTLIFFSSFLCLWLFTHSLPSQEHISRTDRLATWLVLQCANLTLKSKRRVLNIQFMPNRLSVCQKSELFQNDILQIRKLLCNTERRETLSTNHSRFSHFNTMFIYRGSEILIEM